VRFALDKTAHEHTGQRETLRPSLRNGFTAYFVLLRPQNLAECANGRFSQNRPSLDLSPIVLEGRRACREAWDRSGVFLNPNSCKGFEPVPSKEGSWMMAQNDLVVAGIDVAKDKVDVCIRPLPLRRTFASTAEGRRELVRGCAGKRSARR
jgi:hypothetical protein